MFKLARLASQLHKPVARVYSCSGLTTNAGLTKTIKNIQTQKKSKQIVQEKIKVVNPLNHEDFFQINELVKLEELFK